MEPLDIADARSDTYLQTPKKPVISAWAFLDLCQIANSLIDDTIGAEMPASDKDSSRVGIRPIE